MEIGIGSILELVFNNQFLMYFSTISVLRTRIHIQKNVVEKDFYVNFDSLRNLLGSLALFTVFSGCMTSRNLFLYLKSSVQIRLVRLMVKEKKIGKQLLCTSEYPENRIPKAYRPNLVAFYFVAPL